MPRKSRSPCGSGKRRHPSTGRCRLVKSGKKSKKSSKGSRGRPRKGKKSKGSKGSKKSCPSGKVRSRETGRCRSRKRSGKKSKSGKKKSGKYIMLDKRSGTRLVRRRKGSAYMAHVKPGMIQLTVESCVSKLHLDRVKSLARQWDVKLKSGQSKREMCRAIGKKAGWSGRGIHKKIIKDIIAEAEEQDMGLADFFESALETAEKVGEKVEKEIEKKRSTKEKEKVEEAGESVLKEALREGELTSKEIDERLKAEFEKSKSKKEREELESTFGVEGKRSKLKKYSLELAKELARRERGE